MQKARGVPRAEDSRPHFPWQNVIAEHEIRNISCAAQDPEDLCTFAYITKDLQTSHHYCHVFSTVDVVGGDPQSEGASGPCCLSTRVALGQRLVPGEVSAAIWARPL